MDIPRKFCLLGFLTAAVFMLSACAGDGDLGNAGNEGQPDSGVDISDSSTEDADPNDSGPDVEEAADPCSVCCAGETRCSGIDAVETCREDGTGYETTSTCDTDETCEEGACEQEPVCTPGDRECFNGTQVTICRPDGMGYINETCSGETSCIGGECLSGGAHGTTCQDATDCAGDSCRCGDGESCTLAPQPYCTADCTSNSCSGGQVCWKSDGAEAAGYDHCLKSCDSICSLEGLDCTQVPTLIDGDAEWTGACLPPEIKGVGSICQSDSECVTGECRLDYYSDFGYCSHRCEDTGCPDNAPCVNLEGDGNFWCSPRCTSGGTHCPLVEDQVFDGSCNSRITNSGGTAIVCTK